MSWNKTPDNIRDAMVRAYVAGDALTIAAAKHGLSSSACLSALRAAGITPRTVSEAKRKYALNEAYFSRVDTVEKAVILGLIYSDGCVSGTELSFQLQRRDRAVLEAVAIALQSDRPIKDYVCTTKPPGRPGEFRGNYSRLNIQSKRVAQDLAAIGVMEKKSLIIKPWVAPTVELQAAFWYGVWLGDGWISEFATCGRTAWNIGICGNRDMMDGYAEFMRDATAINATPMFTKGVWRVTVGGKVYPQAVMRILYQDAPIQIPRKQEAARKLMSLTFREYYRRDLDADAIKSDRAKGMSLHGLARKYGADRKAIQVRLARPTC